MNSKTLGQGQWHSTQDSFSEKPIILGKKCRSGKKVLCWWSERLCGNKTLTVMDGKMAWGPYKWPDCIVASATVSLGCASPRQSPLLPQGTDSRPADFSIKHCLLKTTGLRLISHRWWLSFGFLSFSFCIHWDLLVHQKVYEKWMQPYKLVVEQPWERYFVRPQGVHHYLLEGGGMGNWPIFLFWCHIDQNLFWVFEASTTTPPFFMLIKKLFLSITF